MRRLAQAALLASALCLAPAHAADMESSETAALTVAEELEFLMAEDFIETEVSVASLRPLPSRRSPGIVSTLTGDELRTWGARDLIDALQMVPGLAFGVDVQGVVGIGVRGHWGHEGKVLLLLDGHELNEGHYSTLQFGNRLPVELIDRIEIIRGPGSALYGGNAELAVINVVTLAGAERTGGHASLSWGQMRRTWGRRRATLGYGHRFGELHAGVAAWIGQGQRSDGVFEDIAGETAEMAGASRLDPSGATLRLSWRGLRVAGLVEHYHTTHRDGFGEVLQEPVRADFTSAFVDVSYAAALGENVTLTPRLAWRRQVPWRAHDVSYADPNWFDSPVQRLQAGLTLEYLTEQGVSLMVAAQAHVDDATFPPETPPERAFPDGARSMQLRGGSVMLQALMDVLDGTLALGARYEMNSGYAASLVPRVALTQPLGRFHFKLLAARAFRAPGIQNVALGPDIAPEITDVVEAEVGYLVTDTLTVSLNAFDVAIAGPIVYAFDPATDLESYRNDERVGTRGVEIDGRWRHRYLALRTSYAFYTPSGRAGSEVYRVPGEPQVHLGLAAHRVTAVAAVPLWRGLRIAPGLLLLSRRHAWTGTPDGEGELAALPAALVLNLAVELRDLPLEGLALSVSVHDLLDQSPPFPQPYDGGHPPLPGPSREVMLRVSYDFE